MRTWDSIRGGDALPVLQMTPGLPELVKYAAGSGDFNPLHFDGQSPQALALGSIIVHGRFKYALLGRLVSEWLGHGAAVMTISCRYLGMDRPGQTLTASGVVVRKWQEANAGLAELELWVENAAGRRTVEGAATVAFGCPFGG